MNKCISLAPAALSMLCACAAPQARQDIRRAYDELGCEVSHDRLQSFAAARNLYLHGNGDATYRIGRESGLNDHYIVLKIGAFGNIEAAELWHLYKGLIPSHEQLEVRRLDCTQS